MKSTFSLLSGVPNPDRDMFLGREFEEMCAQMYYRGKMFGFVHLYSGQEVNFDVSLLSSFISIYLIAT